MKKKTRMPMRPKIMWALVDKRGRQIRSIEPVRRLLLHDQGVASTLWPEDGPYTIRRVLVTEHKRRGK